jgi:hypothetical protein
MAFWSAGLRVAAGRAVAVSLASRNPYLAEERHDIKNSVF